jgi:ABC-type enterobactin transport system permease subunit
MGAYTGALLVITTAGSFGYVSTALGAFVGGFVAALARTTAGRVDSCRQRRVEAVTVNFGVRAI